MDFRYPYSHVGRLEYVNEPGNGSAVPQYYLDKKTLTIKKKLDEKGKQIINSLYDEIQMFAGANDYKKMLEKNNCDLSAFGLGQGAESRPDIDLTKFSSREELMNASARLNNVGVSTESIWKKLKDIFNKHDKQMENVVSGNQTEQKIEQGVKENEIKK